MEKVVSKKPLTGEGIPPCYSEPREALAIFAEILKRGRLFYTDADSSSPKQSKTIRILPLSES